ncbi:ABC transporter ATP-binding protein [Pseudomonas sp. KNUC1026]|uniref:ABC transporter ATP-binding protein n=1 Tax=Pseudomonas sp. KNUC1026 TaxID=2893890 RepID=UPI001F449C70|nr:ABC transporter ATP-binding protein [Pseudomonas sp. KNUC1026]UFH48395.1 ABC transporter ATP-binding protein [Pseudomonas sp. KNUC1026]
MTEPLLTLERVACGYAEQAVVQGLSLSLQPGEIGCLLGPSGCGKTTTLRAIAGFEPLASGQIHLAGRCLARDSYSLAPEQRQIGMVFQDYALFPHLSVAENIAFGLTRGPEAVQRVNELLERVNLAGLGARRPHELSGGQQQRVALARALAPSPRLLLLDEPFSNLDVELRRRLSLEVRGLLKAQGIAAMLVTHDQEEAFAVSDKVGVMRHGVLEQWATPAELYQQPATPWVARFVGQGYFVPGQVRGSCLETELGAISLPGGRWAEGSTLHLLLRPEHLMVGAQDGLPCTVVHSYFQGAHTAFRLRTPGGLELEALLPSGVSAPPGTCLPLARQPLTAVVFSGIS